MRSNARIAVALGLALALVLVGCKKASEERATPPANTAVAPADRAPASAGSSNMEIVRRPGEGERAPPPHAFPSPSRARDVLRANPPTIALPSLAPAGKIFCQRVAAWLTQDECNAAEQTFASTQSSKPRAKVSPDMFKGETQEVTLAVGLPGEGEREAAEIASAGAGQSQTFPTAKVGRRMKAQLTGANFDIKALKPAVQELAPAAAWTWEVTPRAEGVQQLDLETAVIFVDLAGQDHVLASTPQRYPVKVTVRPPPFPDRMMGVVKGSEGWLKAITADVAAIAALLLAAVGLRSAWKKWRSPAPPGSPG